MRLRTLVLMAAAVLGSAGAALGQATSGAAVTAPALPGSAGVSQANSAVGGEAGSRRFRYLSKLDALKDRIAQTKARDGGQLTPEHEADLKRELDRLNQLYGVKG